MRRVFKILGWFIGILLILIVILSVVAKLSENKITNIALDKVSESIEAPVEIQNVSFNLLRKFPFASIELNNVSLGSPLAMNDSISFASSDTIINIDKIFVSVKSKPLMDGVIEIIKVDIDGADIYFNMDTTGATNIDFLMASSDSTKSDTAASAPLNLSLTDLHVKNITCHFSDSTLDTRAKAFIPELKVNGKMKGDTIKGSAKGMLSLSNCSFGKTNLKLMKETNINFDVDYNMDSLNVKDLTIITDGANLSASGNVVMGNKLQADIDIKASDLIFEELIKYVPKEMLRQFGVTKITGKLILDAKVKGNYSESEMPQVNANIELLNGNITTKDYPELKNVSLKGIVTNGVLCNNKSSQANFSSCHFETEQSSFDFAFSVLDLDKLKYDIKTNIKVRVDEFQKFIPDSLLKHIEGNIIADISTKGTMPDSIDDTFFDLVLANSQADIELSNFNVDVDSSLSVKDFSTRINYKPNNFKVSGLNIHIPAFKAKLVNSSFHGGFQGSISNLAGLLIDLKSYEINTPNSSLSGKAHIRDLNHPTYSTTTNIELDLAEAKNHIPDSLVTSLSGKIIAEIKSSGTLNPDSIAEQATDIALKSSITNIRFENVSAQLPDDPLYKIENFSGEVLINPEAVQINKMSGKASDIDFAIDSTSIKNLYNTIIKNKKEQLVINTRLNLGNLDYAMFAPFMASDTTKVEKEQNSEKEATPANYSMLIKGKANVASLTYDKVLLEDISTLFNIKDSVYTIDQLKFSAFEGDMNTSVLFTLKPDGRSVIQMRNIIDSMDIKKLLSDFDNFEDYYEPAIKQENISGLFSTTLYSRIEFLGDSMLTKKMRVKGDIKLENGGIFDFEPAMALSKFTGIDELDNIQFKTLDSKIFIFNEAIYVPVTFIASTALDITASGMQGFGEDYEYQPKIHLGEVLFGKSKAILKEQEKMGDIVEEGDRNGLKILMYSENGKTKTKWNTKKKQNRLKNKIKVQETMLNLVFHPGMVNFETNVYKEKQ